MLIRKLEVERYHKFRREFIHAAEGPDDDVSDDDVASAYLSERSGPHRGRPTPIDAVRDELIRMGCVPLDPPACYPPEVVAPLDVTPEVVVVVEAPAVVFPAPVVTFDITDGKVTEVERVSVEAGLADIAAGRTMTTDELRERLEERRAERGALDYNRTPEEQAHLDAEIAKATAEIEAAADLPDEPDFD